MFHANKTFPFTENCKCGNTILSFCLSVSIANLLFSGFFSGLSDRFTADFVNVSSDLLMIFNKLNYLN